MKIALIHDWLTGMRGGEKVLAELLDLFPAADLFTLLWKQGSVPPEIERRVRATSFLQRLPRITEAYRYYLPLYPAAIRSFDLSGYDLVLSSSHAVAKGAAVPLGATHVSYVHTPMRYLWETGPDYFQFGGGRRWKRLAMRMAAPYLRRFDCRTASGVDHYLANSENVRARIRRAYGRDARVIPPPVDTGFFVPDGSPRTSCGYYLVVSSLEPYKRIDLAVDAFSGGTRTLLIAGKGTLDRDLRRRARKPVYFLGEVSNRRLRELYQNCRALIFPGVEDFGMVPVEAQACGRPVVCYGQGGALETVVDGRTGVHFHQQTADALLEAIEVLERTEWNPSTIRRNSLAFSRQKFRERFAAFWRGELFSEWDSDSQGAASYSPSDEPERESVA